jgi:hypothetical protein
MRRPAGGRRLPAAASLIAEGVSSGRYAATIAKRDEKWKGKGKVVTPRQINTYFGKAENPTKRLRNPYHWKFARKMLEEAGLFNRGNWKPSATVSDVMRILAQVPP